jgi:Mitochondrial carrier protein
MQVNSLSLAGTVSNIVKNEGWGSFYKGILFGYGRELSYTSIKLGAYAPVRDLLVDENDKNAPFFMKFLAGAITGGTGSVVGNPFDVLKTLSQTNTSTTKVPLTSLVKDLYSHEGIGGFYRGVEVNVLRACVLNATKMGVYDICKGFVVKSTGWNRSDIRTVFSSAVVAGYFMTCTVAPFDMIRTKLMNQKTGGKTYSGFVDCFAQTIRQDGFFSLWRGFIPIWARFAPQATLQLMTLEFLYGVCGFKSI